MTEQKQLSSTLEYDEKPHSSAKKYLIWGGLVVVCAFFLKRDAH